MIDQESLDDQMFSQEMLLADLSDDAKTLFAELARFQYCLQILYYLRSNASTMLTANDLAYHLAKPPGTIDKDLATLAQLGLAQTISVAGITMYQFATNPARQKVAQELCAWQDRWETRIKEIVRLIWGSNSHVTFVAPAETREGRTPSQRVERTIPSWATSLTHALNGGENG